MVKLEDLHIGDKVRTCVCDNLAEIVKIESIPYINYQTALKRTNEYDRPFLEFINDTNRYGGIIYNCVTLNIKNQSGNILVGTDISNILEIIKPIKKEEKVKKELLIKRLFRKIF